MVARVLVLMSLPLLCGACKAGWQYLEVEEISYSDFFNLTAHVIDSEGFAPDANPHTGEILSKWDYNKLLDVGRFPIRRRVRAQIDPVGEGRLKLGMRIEQEALWESYRIDDLPNKKGWEEYGFDKETTYDILTRIKLIVKDFKPSDDFYEKYERIDRLREE